MATSNRFLRLVVISDTHSQHRFFPSPLPRGDVLVHCGDLAKSRTVLKPEEYRDFVNWFSDQPHPRKVMICGNRDDFMDSDVMRSRDRNMDEVREVQSWIIDNDRIDYLQDSQLVIPSADGEGSVKFWGSPWTQQYSASGKPSRKGFQLPPGEALQEKWDLIPSDTDVLLTHGPPHTVCDLSDRGIPSGCPGLLKTVVERVKPRLHMFGHIHEGYGTAKLGQTQFVNAASINKKTRKLTNPPVVIDFPFSADDDLIVGAAPTNIV